jgi:hypothetical protein
MLRHLLKAALDARFDKVGKDPADMVHQVRLDLLACLHGWNPSTAARCESVDFGYCSKLMTYVGDSFFTMHRELVIWEFNFDLKSTLTNADQGFGTSNPVATEPLERIHADFNPTEVTASENPATQAIVEL